MNKKSLLVLLALVIGASSHAKAALATPIITVSKEMADAVAKSTIATNYSATVISYAAAALCAVISAGIITDITLKLKQYFNDKANNAKWDAERKENAELNKLRKDVDVAKAKAAKQIAEKALAENKPEVAHNVTY